MKIVWLRLYSYFDKNYNECFSLTLYIISLKITMKINTSNTNKKKSHLNLKISPSLPSRIILAGFMGTGKSSLGKILAQKLKYQFVDTDQLIEKTHKKSPHEIFVQHGEKTFRKWEKEALIQATKSEKAVIAVGGGAVCSKSNLKMLEKAGLLIHLTASPQTILERTSLKPAKRPLLNCDNPLAKILSLLEQRKKFYDAIPFQFSSDHGTPHSRAEQLKTLIQLEQQKLHVNLQQNAYDLYFSTQAKKVFAGLSIKIKQLCPKAQSVIVVTNDTVAPLWGKSLHDELKTTFQVHTITLPDGEQYKRLKYIQEIYSKALVFGADRDTPFIALGGGVIGDMTGFAAASYLRGVPYIQIPTTLLSQVDSSIGGKTGVDLPEGKNLIGAFYQPQLVWINPHILKTLDRRQLSCGLAEVIKYAAIFDDELFAELEAKLPRLLDQVGPKYLDIIYRCCAWKGWVVENDEREKSGLRSLLNFGHSLGHAIESITRYKKYTHGEAIAMGMVFAARLSQTTYGLSEDDCARLVQLLKAAELPNKVPQFPAHAILQALQQDKKRVSKDILFVYLKKIGEARLKATPLQEIVQKTKEKQ